MADAVCRTFSRQCRDTITAPQIEDVIQDVASKHFLAPGYHGFLDYLSAGIMLQNYKKGKLHCIRTAYESTTFSTQSGDRLGDLSAASGNEVERDQSGIKSGETALPPTEMNGL